jgi:hypothetical protein
MSKKKTILISGIILIFGILYVDAYIDGLAKKARGRVALTNSTLIRLRNEISQYYKENNLYPSNLNELKKYIINSGERDTIKHSFYIGFRQVPDFENHETNVLDGSGGLYYNNETGEIRVNFNKPVKFYERFSPIKRNEIPSEW